MGFKNFLYLIDFKSNHSFANKLKMVISLKIKDMVVEILAREMDLLSAMYLETHL